MTCSSCGTRFERFLMRMLRQEDKVCPSCGSTEVTTGLGGGYVRPSSRSEVSDGCSNLGGFG
ncbi:MAG: zinc ribbon domain-containing protein [Coriobacteriia bacterium]|nr:zinc ribbon domain-containing protein [Coriobacteriia bacterium]MBN2823064.1 zinc ribbon domain-containing protein [Coriobacteriia bacterium]